MSELSEALWKTLDFHRSHAWVKGEYRSGEKYCVVGAFRGAADLHGRWQEMEFLWAFISVATEMFPKANGDPWRAAQEFNDHHLTRKWMVDQVLEKAAIRADEVLA